MSNYVDPPVVTLSNYLTDLMPGPPIQARQITQPLGSIADIQGWIQHITAAGERTLRTAGCRHSWRSAWETNGFSMDMRGCNKNVKLDDHSQLRDAVKARHFARVGAGSLVREVNEYLKSADLTLATMGNFNGQTLVGGLQVGTHGTSFGVRGQPMPHGPMASLVRSIVLVDKLGRVWRIEPSDERKITDPARFHEAGVVLKQDNDWFDSVVLGLGAMGVIWEVTVEAEPMVWIRELRRYRKWADVKLSLTNGHPDIVQVDGVATGLSASDEQRMRGWTVVLVPYPSPDGSYLVIETLWLAYTKDEATKFKPAGDCVVALIAELFELNAVQDDWHNHPERIPDGVASNLRKLVTFAPHDVAGPLPDIMSTDFSGHVPRGTASEPALPYWMGTTPAALATRTSVVTAVEALISQLAWMAKESPPLYHGGYFALRFVGDFNAMLSTTKGGDRCTVELAAFASVPNFERVLDRLEATLVDHFGGRPHWAQHNLFRHGDASTRFHKLYGDVSTWRAVRNQLDPQGIPATHPERLFDNAYIVGMGLS